MSTKAEAVSRQGLEAHAANTNRIVITVTPDTRPRRYRSYVGAEQEPLCVSRQPFLDGARQLLARGHDPQTMLMMRWAGAKDWALRGPLGVAAKLTVDEHNGTFAKWKPYSRSAARQTLRRPLTKQRLTAPPRKDGELRPGSNRAERPGGLGEDP
jgi:hypothetical protein